MSEHHPEFEDILTGHTESIKAIARILRNKVLSLDSEIIEQIMGGDYVKGASYYIGEPGNVIAVIQPAEDHCKIYLHHFNDVDPGHLELEGSGQHARHIKLHDPDELPRAELKRILHDITHLVKTN
jgi:hypothetical protein